MTGQEKQQPCYAKRKIWATLAESADFCYHYGEGNELAAQGAQTFFSPDEAIAAADLSTALHTGQYKIRIFDGGSTDGRR